MPPRAIAPGDVVAVFFEPLGEWTAAQITGLDPEGSCAGVLDLDWSGPEPSSVADLGDVQPLRVTHHQWSGALSYRNCDWVLPRSYKVVGSLPLLHDERSNSYGGGWGVGHQLFLQRRWDRGEERAWVDRHAVEYTGEEFGQVLDQPPLGADPAVRRLTVRGVAELDVDRLVARFPRLTSLTLVGNLGTLVRASSLNGLPTLMSLSIRDLFGMDAADCLLPSAAPALESLELDSVPVEYAEAMRAAWLPEAPLGVSVDIRKARKPKWLAKNRDNPFRTWDGDDYIPRGAYKKSVAQYMETREAVLAVLADASAPDRPARLVEIGERYGEGFNELDEKYEFIDTVERERLFEVLDQLVDVAVAELGLEPGTGSAWARESLAEGVESVRDW